MTTQLLLTPYVQIMVTMSVALLTLFLSGVARSQGQYEPGTILLRLTVAAVNDPNFLIQPPSSTNTQSGLAELDSVLSIYGQSEFQSPLVTPQDTVLATRLGLDRDYCDSRGQYVSSRKKPLDNKISYAYLSVSIENFGGEQ